MFVKPSGFPAKDFISKRRLFCFPVLALAISASTGWAQAPSIVVDAQQTIGFGYTNPQTMAISKNGTVFISDPNNNRILALNPTTGVSTPVSTGTITLQLPTPIALDANGDLFVGDTPSGIGGRIVELLADGTGNLTGAAKSYFAGSPLTNPIALVVDSSGTLFIGDDHPSTSDDVIYSLPSPGTTLTALSFPGIPTEFFPASLFRAGTNLYIADNGDLQQGIGGVYVAPATGGNAQRIPTGSFLIKNPTGIRLDAAGNIYILSFLGTGEGYNAGPQVVIVPAASPDTPYILPSSGFAGAGDMAFDPAGNLDVLDSVSGKVFQLISSNPVNLGNKNHVGGTGSPVQFNFEFNAPLTLRGFRVVTQGDVSTELIQSSGGSCVNGKHTNLGTGGPTISPYFPYTCVENFYGSPTYPGIRSSAIQVKGQNGILASTPVYQTGFAGAEITYPLTETITATGLQEPQAVAISGLNKTVYVADSGSAQVYSIKGLGGSAMTPVSTGTVTLSAPIALALDGVGDLFIADYNNAEVVEVPPTDTGVAPSVVNTGGLLQHPIALAFDFLGNLYIGDSGPDGLNASSGNPGFVVKIPVGGAAFKMTIPDVPIVFPQALATDPYTAALLIGDGGDPSGVGKVVQVYPDGTVGTGPINGVTSPSGLAFDAAEDLYILDGNANTITVVEGPQAPGSQHQVKFDNSKLVAASSLAISAGGQNFVIANLGGPGSSNLVHLNGNRSTLAFGGVKFGNQSQTLTATEYNIGNMNMTLGSPWYTTNGSNAAFNVLGSSFCDDGNFLAPGWSCTIDVQFTPQFIGQTTQQLTVQSDGYNGGSGAISAPILTLRGTGTK
jgi:sugar lactone lactonase YvrE